MDGDEKETIPITCPLCHEEHEYPLKISRSVSIGYFTPDSFKREKQRQRRVQCYFICPLKNQKFRATLLLWELPSQAINSVEAGESIKK